MPWRWLEQAGSIEERKGIQLRECPFVSEQRARLALMRQLFVAGLSTSSGLVDSLTWLLQIKQAGTRDAYDSTLKAPLNPPTTGSIPPLLFPPVSQASQGSSDRRKSASGLFQVSQIRDGGDFHFPYSVSFIPWDLISVSALDSNTFSAEKWMNWLRLLQLRNCSFTSYFVLMNLPCCVEYF